MHKLKFKALDINNNWWYGEISPKGNNHINLATFFTNLYSGVLQTNTLQFTYQSDKFGKEIYKEVF